MQKKAAKIPVHHAPHARQVRIIGGLWKRTTLPVLDALGLRPTPDRVRETVFNWIRHLRGGVWDDIDCLDLFAGSGALGFEAASRGARSVTMVDSHTPIIRQLEENKIRLRAEQVHLIRGDALATAQGMAARGQRFDLIFLDPPYQQDWLIRALPLAVALLKEGGLVYAESGQSLLFDDSVKSSAQTSEASVDAAVTSTANPDWMESWQVIRSDKAGTVFYHLLTLKSVGND